MRNAATEQEFFRSISRDADVDLAERFQRALKARLVKGGEEYGEDSFRERTFPEVLAEATQEGEDFPSWLVLGVHLLRDEQLPQGTREHIEMMLIAASAKVFEAWQILELALEMYEEDRPKAPPSRPVTCLDTP